MKLFREDGRAASDGVDATTWDRIAGDRQALLVVVTGLDHTTHGASDDLSGKDRWGLLAEDEHAVTEPVDADVSEDKDEADHRNQVGDASSGGIGNGTLDRWEDRTARDTHDQDTSTTSGVLAEVGSSEGENCRVHRSHEEENDDQHGDAGDATCRGDVGSQGDGDAE